MAEEKQGLIFISCGQFRPEEKKLGRDLAKAITNLTKFQGYFAENQTSLEGLSQNSFGALNRCSGFVAVIHHRGEVQTMEGKHTRASVWVEQEIAIAAFLQQAQARKLEVAVYIQNGIKREGVREQLLLNAVGFDTENEVLADLTTRIKTGTFNPIRLSAPKEVGMRLEWRVVSQSDRVHQYLLVVLVKNTGSDPLTDYWVDVLFPPAALDNYYGALMVERTNAHAVLRVTREIVGVDLYPEDEREVINIGYHMNNDLLRDGSILREVVVARCGSTGMTIEEVK
jgi:hypothetical protein